MGNRPKITIILSPADKVAEALGRGVLVLLWIVPLISYHKLPDTIPIHFDGSGKVDGYGNKLSIFLLPVMSVFIFAGLTALNKVPYLFNYPKNITADNAAAQYTLATRMLRYVKLSVMIVFLIIEIVTCMAALGVIREPGTGFLPMLIGLIIVPVVFFLIKIFRAK